MTTSAGLAPEDVGAAFQRFLECLDTTDIRSQQLADEVHAYHAQLTLLRATVGDVRNGRPSLHEAKGGRSRAATAPATTLMSALPAVRSSGTSDGSFMQKSWHELAKLPAINPALFAVEDDNDVKVSVPAVSLQTQNTTLNLTPPGSMEPAPSSPVVPPSPSSTLPRRSPRTKRTSPRRSSNASHGGVQLRATWQAETPIIASSALSHAPTLTIATSRGSVSHFRDWTSMSHMEMSMTPEGTFHHFGQLVPSKRMHIRRCVMAPSSSKVAVWDALCMFCIAWDMILFPMQAFDLDGILLLEVMRYVITGFWSLDILMTFLRGYLAEGVVEMRMMRIARQYLSTWFAVDVTVVAVDWALTLLDTRKFEESVVLVRAVKATRIIRVVRAMRFLSMFRGDSLAQFVNEHFVSERMAVVFGVIRLLGIVALLTHFIACAWYAVGEHNYHSGRESWLAPLEEEGATKFKEYLISFHWVLAQFTPAPVNYHAAHESERILSVFILLFGLVMFSMFLSSVTSILTQFRNVFFGRLRETQLTHRYLNENKVSRHLGNGIKYYLRMAKHNSRIVLEPDIPLLKELPETLLTQLRMEIYSPALVAHPLFGQLNERPKLASLVAEVCHSAIHERAFGKYRQLFKYGAEAKHMYFVKRGAFRYWPGSRDHVTGMPLDVSNKTGGIRWICELVLWAHWEHRGVLTATTYESCMMELRAKDFHDVVKRHTHAMVHVRRYARLFVERVMKSSRSIVLQDIMSSEDELTALAEEALKDYQDEDDATMACKDLKEEDSMELQGPTSEPKMSTSDDAKELWESAEEDPQLVCDTHHASATPRTRPPVSPTTLARDTRVSPLSLPR